MVVQVGEAPRRIGLPDFDQAVGHRLSGPVVDGAPDRDRSRSRFRYGERPSAPRQADLEEGPDGL